MRFRRFLLLVAVLAISFAGKAAFRLWFSDPATYWKSGYSFYHRMAAHLLETGHLTVERGEGIDYPCYRAPAYPAVMAAVCWITHDSAAAFIIFQALISTVTAALVYWITRHLAGDRAALWSAAFCACFPYAFVHDTQQQENGLYNALSTASIATCLLGLQRTGRLGPMLLAGVIAGLAALTRASHVIPATVLPLVVLWSSDRPRPERLRRATAILIGLCLAIVPWMLRNHAISGHFALTSQSGVSFGLAHNAQTFDFYPYRGSIDQSWAEYHRRMPPEKAGELQSVIRDEFQASDWYLREGLRYVHVHPLETIRRGFEKALVNFVGVLSPLADPVKNWTYALSFWFLTILALTGMRQLRGTSFPTLFWGMMLAQAAFSFVYYAHTSHRSYLDPLLAVPAGIGMQRVMCALQDRRNRPTRLPPARPAS